MNSTTLLISLSENSNSTKLINQSWFIPFDIISIIFLILSILIGLIFLSIILSDKTCHTVSLMLVTNSCFATVFFVFTLLCQTMISLHNDLKQIIYEDPSCKFRSYITYVGCSELFYSYLLQAIYRYIIIVYPTYLFLQSAKLQFILIVLTWTCAFLCPSPYILTGEIRYHVDAQICHMDFHLSIVLVYNVFSIYIIPMGGIVFIYFKLVGYVRDMSKRVIQENTLFHAQRELRMVFRIVTLVSILLIFGLPYAIFEFMGFFVQPPKYYLRIAFLSSDISLFLFIIALFQFTDPVKRSIIKRINRRKQTVVVPVI